MHYPLLENTAIPNPGTVNPETPYPGTPKHETSKSGIVLLVLTLSWPHTKRTCFKIKEIAIKIHDVIKYRHMFPLHHIDKLVSMVWPTKHAREPDKYSLKITCHDFL